MVKDLASGRGCVVSSSPLASSYYHKSRILCPLNTLTPTFCRAIKTKSWRKITRGVYSKKDTMTHIQASGH